MPLIGISTEFVSFSNKISPLGKEMIEIFKEGNKIREDTVGTIHVKVNAVLDWFKKDGAIRLAKLIENHIGVKIDKIHLSRSCDFGYAIQMKIGDKYGLNAAMILDRISGRPVNTYYESIIEQYKLYKPTYEELEKISQSFDEHTGKFNDVKLANGSNVTAGLYFDPYSAFFLKDMCHEKLGYLLPEEVAAIMMHECGHLVSCLLKAVDLWFVSNARNAVMKEFMTKAPLSEKLKALRVMGSKGPNSDIVKSAIAVIDKLMGEATNSSGKDAVGPLILMLITCALVLCSFPVYFVYDSIMVLLDQVINYRRNKLSDFYSSSKNIKYSEQLADSYVVRNGLGSFLSSSLTKAESIPMFGGYNSRRSSMVWYCNKLCLIYFSLIIRDYTLYDEHEKLVRRQISIANDTLKVLKQSDISDDMKAFYVEDYERQLEWISKVPKTTKLIERIQAVRAFIDFISVTPITEFIGGRFNAEYDKLFRNVEFLLSNDLGYRAAKLELLAKK